MANSGPLKDVSTAYDSDLEIATEPELDLPENTIDEITKKIAALQQKSKRLSDGIATDVAADGNKSTIMTVPLKDKYHTNETLTESKFDEKLQAKKTKIDKDTERLNTRKESFSAIKTSIGDQGQAYLSSQGFKLYSGALKSAETYLRNQKRRSTSKKSGKTGGSTSRARSITKASA